MKRKFVFFSAFVFLLAFAVPAVTAHDEKSHTQDIREVFGVHTDRGKQIFCGEDDKIGGIIAALIDGGADSLLAQINREIAEICCKEKYYSLFLSEYNKKTIALQERFSALEEKMKKASSSRKEIIYDMLDISKEMQDDRYLGRKKMSAAACNIEGELNKLQRALEYGHDFPEEDLKILFRKMKDSFRDEVKMSQQSFREIQEQIRDLLKKKKPFQWGSKYRHRLFFHWGMDVRLREFIPLKECVKQTRENLKALFPDDEKDAMLINELLDAVRDKIYSLIETEWNRRCQTALEDVDSCLKKDSPDKGLLNNDQIRMILEISYYVHILGDYSDPTIDPLVEVRDIREALSKNLTDDLWGHKEGNRKMTDIQNRLLHMDTAEELLKFLKAEIPKLIADSDRIRNALW